MNRDDFLEAVNQKLIQVGHSLDECASLIREAELNYRDNIRRIGEALAILDDVQHDIWNVRPDLMPENAKPGWEDL
jgi:hypothetical protein